VRHSPPSASFTPPSRNLQAEVKPVWDGERPRKEFQGRGIRPPATMEERIPSRHPRTGTPSRHPIPSNIPREESPGFSLAAAAPSAPLLLAPRETILSPGHSLPDVPGLVLVAGSRSRQSHRSHYLRSRGSLLSPLRQPADAMLTDSRLSAIHLPGRISRESTAAGFPPVRGPVHVRYTNPILAGFGTPPPEA
jgi:hypothetical protein